MLFFRLLIIALSILFMMVYTTAFEGGWTFYNMGLGCTLGILVGGVLITIEKALQSFHLFSLNVAIVGILAGYLMGQAIVLVLDTILSMVSVGGASENWLLVRIFIYLSMVYSGIVLTYRASQELHLSIPFIRLSSKEEKGNQLLLDQAAILDSRLIDLAASGLLDHRMAVPRFLVKEFVRAQESLDEDERMRGRRAIEILKKLEAMPSLHLRYEETDFADLNDGTAKVIRLARMKGMSILTSEYNRIKQSTIESSEGVKLINLHLLANALKPLSQSGETLEIKIQRHGKEVGQGVGYLEDGTMVVVNGGADFMGRTIPCQVLSVKHTSSGRMIFCNAVDEFVEQESVKPCFVHN